ncbi:single-stranded-DNA-specific exonuclease RecJ [Geobacter metallireducens RCH3]|uniref:Single-stranded-DNA-specific exonuclease RecJ n=1 Tax=Geobacter metallireducens (strain ATCC 53774 / DSM 7210 / GS-15) TaxID=269799 RepID=Q39XC5_GEOMG|nr:single-stranded-DNA-specific exonuclease RecJ [Geobacter metallireducens]ABB31099.1 single-stranded DNA-specific exonuclease RecJ [Geobacter metallireducens GS-15]EHP86879.1 single-stranded-DNA-specific exonuclease RecJ [Geobacter metallireducens RCH3]
MKAVAEKRWELRTNDKEAAQRIASDSSVDPFLAALLANRGIADGESARRFLSSSLGDVSDPFLLKGMEEAVARLCAARARRETVCVYGDYDVDGITATALLVSFFRAVGIRCFYHIPKRLEEGYGLSVDGLRKVAEQAQVVVTVDCGVNAVAEAELCLTLGVDLVITDHHTPGPAIPKACAVINPLQPGCSYPFKSLAGVGVAFNVMVALRGRLRAEGAFAGGNGPNLREYLDLVALGTIADVVPLVGENRIFVKYGLRELSASSRVGVKALKDVAGVTGAVSCGAVGFRLAPRLNAAGRMEDAAAGVELLLETEPGRAAAIAAELDANNDERQALERQILTDALGRVQGNTAMEGRKSIVLASAAWHPGVIGIVASRMVDLFHRPTVLIALQEGNGRGSGRSIPGFHLYDALGACADQLVKFGGHRYAAGLSIDEPTLELFVDRFEEVAAGLLSADDLIPVLRVDAVLSAQQVTAGLADALSSLEPFGAGNPEPLFVLKDMEIVRRWAVRGNHLKVRLSGGGFTFDAIGFNLATKEDSLPDLVDIVFTLGWNEWNGRKTLQLSLKDIRESGQVLEPC